MEKGKLEDGAGRVWLPAAGTWAGNFQTSRADSYNQRKVTIALSESTTICSYIFWVGAYSWIVWKGLGNIFLTSQEDSKGLPNIIAHSTHRMQQTNTVSKVRMVARCSGDLF
jgi:hypothetical protein